MGDPAGISGTARQAPGEPELMARAAVTVFGDRRILETGERIAGVDLIFPSPLRPNRRPRGSRSSSTLCISTPPASRPARQARRAAPSRCGIFGSAAGREGGRLDAVMFTPFNKLALKRGGNPYPDEIRWAADVLQWKGSCSEYNKLDELWNARVPRMSRCGMCPRC